jgi:hypothetical protein
VPVSLLSKEDLPTLGRPSNATRSSSVASSYLSAQKRRRSACNEGGNHERPEEKALDQHAMTVAISMR